MDGVQLLFKLKKIVEMRRDDVVNGMIAGVDNFDKISIYVRTDKNLSLYFTGNL